MSRRRKSSPHPRGVPLPTEDPDAALQRAAEVLSSADALLICTGAGMGVDCGFGTFQGRNAGVWAPLRALCLDYQQMSDPDWFESDPRLAWAYWGFQHKLYCSTMPHAGYELLVKWGSSLPQGYFSITSNIDGHWRRVSRPGSVFECHGSVTHFQTVSGEGPIWEADHASMASLEIPTWDLLPEESVEFRVADKGVWGPWCEAVVGEDGCSIFRSGERVKAHSLRRPGGNDLLRVPENCRLPCSDSDGQLARPNVLLFGDPMLNTTWIDQQEQVFNSWLSALPTDVRLAILEIGAGCSIPTIRDTAEEIWRRFPSSTLVRINLDDSHIGECFAGRAVSVGGLGALDALTKLDAYVGAKASSV